MNIDIEIDEQQLLDALEYEMQSVVDHALDNIEMIQRDDVEDIASEWVDDAVSNMELEIDKKVSKLQGKIESLERLVKQIQSQSMRAVRLAKK
jgi:hypothetical protein